MDLDARPPVLYRHVIWDWNGTLSDDVALSAELCSAELRARGLAALSVADYRLRFRHPVRSFYEALGLDLTLNPYQELADSFHEKYLARFPECVLFQDARAALAAFAGWGMTQSILSALPHVILEQSVRHLGIAHFFTHVRGLDSNKADSKVENARAWMAEQDLTPDQVLLIGDTDHDVEAARALDVDCMLISRGYQDAAVLIACGVPVFESAESLVQHLAQRTRRGKAAV